MAVKRKSRVGGKVRKVAKAKKGKSKNLTMTLVIIK